MVDVYLRLIPKGLWKLSNVPSIWHDDVEAGLRKMNYFEDHPEEDPKKE